MEWVALEELEKLEPEELELREEYLSSLAASAAGWMLCCKAYESGQFTARHKPLPKFEHKAYWESKGCWEAFLAGWKAYIAFWKEEQTRWE